MDTIYPLTVYYDHSCPICRNEVFRLNQRDHANQMLLVDCSSAGFTPPAGAPAQEAMMQLIHAQTANGSWLVGVPVFQHMYRASGFGSFAGWLAKPKVMRIMTRIYPHIARHRYLIPGWATHVFINLLARKSVKRSQTCTKNQCSL